MQKNASKYTDLHVQISNFSGAMPEHQCWEGCSTLQKIPTRWHSGAGTPVLHASGPGPLAPSIHCTPQCLLAVDGTVCGYTNNLYTVSQKNCATFVFTVTLTNFGGFLKLFHCRNQKLFPHKAVVKVTTSPEFYRCTTL